MIRPVSFLVLVVLAHCAILDAGAASACSCVGPREPAESLASAEAVFVGVVRGVEREVSASSQRQMRQFRFEVLGAWKGVARERVLIRTGNGGGDCGYAFAVGGVYLVYANAMVGSEVFSTSICTRTRPIDRAADDFALLAEPSFSPVPLAEWARKGPPDRCLVHSGVHLRPWHGWTLEGLSREAARSFYAARQSEFPYAGLGADTSFMDSDPIAYGADSQGYVCGVCREAALEWAHHHGMPCRTPKVPGRVGRTAPSAEFSDDQYRRAYPDRNFAFKFDDGRRLRLDTIEGRLERRYGMVPDTSIALVLADTTMRRLYDLMIAQRAFDRDEPHPGYPDADRAGEPVCTTIEFLIRSDTLVREYRWQPALAPRAPARGESWSALQVVARAIASAIEAHPAYRSLPARDAR